MPLALLHVAENMKEAAYLADELSTSDERYEILVIKAGLCVRGTRHVSAGMLQDQQIISWPAIETSRINLITRALYKIHMALAAYDSALLQPE